MTGVPIGELIMEEERKQELKITDISFKGSLKFWLAHLVVTIIAMLIAISLVFAIARFLVPPTPFPTPSLPSLYPITPIKELLTTSSRALLLPFP